MIYLYIDTTNQYINCHKTFGGRKIDYAKYVEAAKLFCSCSNIRVVAYVAKHDEGFVHHLMNLGFDVRVKRGNVTVDMVVDILTFHKPFDSLIIGSGSPDLLPMIQKLEDVTMFSVNISPVYKNIVDCVEVTDDLFATE